MNKSLTEALAKLQTDNPFTPLIDPALLIAFALCLLGFILNVYSGNEDKMRAFARVFVVSVLIAAIPLWSTIIRDVVNFLPYTLLDYHTGLSKVYEQITDAVGSAIDSTPNDFSFFDMTLQVILDAVAAMLMRIIATLGSVIAIPLLFVQVLLEKVLLALMPIALALFTIPATRSIGQGFVAFWMSILLWPFGFAVTTIMAGSVFTVSNNLGMLWADIGSGGGFLSNFLAPFASAAIMLGGIITTPAIMYSLCSHGGASISGPNVSSAVQSSVVLATRR